jgi:hypothetical protein
MSQKFFVPGWDELSPVQKTLVEEWIRGALRAKAAREALIKSYCDLNFNESASYIENLSSEPSFEVFGSQSSLEERIELKSIASNSILDLACIQERRRYCQEHFPNDNEGYRDCVNNNNC